MTNKEQRNRNLRSLRKVLGWFNKLWIIAVFVVLPYIVEGTEDLRVYGIAGVVWAWAFLPMLRATIRWCDRTGRDWDGDLWFVGVTLVATLPSTVVFYAAKRFADHAPNWGDMLGFSWADVLVAFIAGSLLCCAGSLLTTVITHYRRGEHIVLRGRPANSYWQICLIVVGMIIVPGVIWYVYILVRGNTP